MRLTHAAMSVVFASLTALSLAMTLSYLLDRSAVLDYYRAPSQSPPFYRPPSDEGVMANQIALALSLNPLESAFWLHRSNFFESALCTGDEEICHQRVVWLSKAVALRPTFDRAWASLVSAHLTDGDAEQARVAMQNARLFAPLEYHTNLAVIKYGAATWEVLGAPDRELVIQAFENLLGETKSRFIRDVTGSDLQSRIDIVARETNLYDEYSVARDKRLDRLQRLQR